MVYSWQNGGFGLYVHWPFCQAKCPYCDFNSHVAASIDQTRWQEAYLSELRRTGTETEGRTLNSIYFGGGTPSLMDPSLVRAIIDEARRHWRFSNDIEITLEANPTSVEAGRFEGYRLAGVERISLGVQALNEPDLKALGRLHSVDEAISALHLGRSIFDRISFDLIYARQNQTLPDWCDELQRALDLGTDHMSLYQLTIEDGTAFGERFAKGGLRGLPGEDLAADMFFATQEIMEDAGLPAYEVSNHAKKGQKSRHNLIYWRGGDYVGIGPGAHGRLTLDGQRHATETHLAPGKWLSAVEDGGNGESLRDRLDPDDVAVESLLMGLRTADGVDLSDLPAQNYDIINNIKYLNEDDYRFDGQRLVITPAGRPILNAILRRLLA